MSIQVIMIDEINYREKIVEMFDQNVKGKKYTKNIDDKHDGREGHWLEKLMGIKPNSNNKPDLYGYEMKKQSAKISFGDWSADEYLFSKNKQKLIDMNQFDISMTRDEFIKAFGNQNSKRAERYSWSGKCVPKYGKWNECGQKLYIDDDNNILALYCNKHDERGLSIRDELKTGTIRIAIWYRNKMKKRIENKFNQNVFFICKKNKDKEYDKICFGIIYLYKFVIIIHT